MNYTTYTMILDDFRKLIMSIPIYNTFVEYCEAMESLGLRLFKEDIVETDYEVLEGFVTQKHYTVKTKIFFRFMIIDDKKFSYTKIKYGI